MGAASSALAIVALISSTRFCAREDIKAQLWIDAAGQFVDGDLRQIALKRQQIDLQPGIGAAVIGGDSMIQLQLRHLQGEPGALAVVANLALRAFEDGCGDRQFLFGVQQLVFPGGGIQARQNFAFDDIGARLDKDFKNAAVDLKSDFFGEDRRNPPEETALVDDFAALDLIDGFARHDRGGDGSRLALGDRIAEGRL